MIFYLTFWGKEDRNVEDTEQPTNEKEFGAG